MNSKRCVEPGDLGPGFDNDHGGMTILLTASMAMKIKNGYKFLGADWVPDSLSALPEFSLMWSFYQPYVWNHHSHFLDDKAEA